MQNSFSSIRYFGDSKFFLVGLLCLLGFFIVWAAQYFLDSKNSFPSPKSILEADPPVPVSMKEPDWTEEYRYAPPGSRAVPPLVSVRLLRLTEEGVPIVDDSVLVEEERGAPTGPQICKNGQYRYYGGPVRCTFYKTRESLLSFQDWKQRFLRTERKQSCAALVLGRPLGALPSDMETALAETESPGVIEFDLQTREGQQLFSAMEQWQHDRAYDVSLPECLEKFGRTLYDQYLLEQRQNAFYKREFAFSPGESVPCAWNFAGEHIELKAQECP